MGRAVCVCVCVCVGMFVCVCVRVGMFVCVGSGKMHSWCNLGTYCDEPALHSGVYVRQLSRAFAAFNHISIHSQPGVVWLLWLLYVVAHQCSTATTPLIHVLFSTPQHPSHYRLRLLDASRYLLTLPGSPDQTLHADASLEAEDAAGLRLPTYAVNVYIPLVDLTESNGALQVIPGTHRGVREARYEGGSQQGEQGEQEPQEWQGAQGAQGRGEGVGGKAGEAGEQRQPPILMTVPAGSVVLYDFRLLHRGTMNQGDRRTTRRTANSDAAPAATASSTAAPHPPSLAGSRPVLYLTFARPWFTDKGEFSDESVWDAPT